MHLVRGKACRHRLDLLWQVPPQRSEEVVPPFFIPIDIKAWGLGIVDQTEGELDLPVGSIGQFDKKETVAIFGMAPHLDAKQSEAFGADEAHQPTPLGITKGSLVDVEILKNRNGNKISVDPLPPLGRKAVDILQGPQGLPIPPSQKRRSTWPDHGLAPGRRP